MYKPLIIELADSPIKGFQFNVFLVAASQRMQI